jgi:hypothetical protein
VRELLTTQTIKNIRGKNTREKSRNENKKIFKKRKIVTKQEDKKISEKILKKKKKKCFLQSAPSVPIGGILLPPFLLFLPPSFTFFSA